jgi:hypothetical protein
MISRPRAFCRFKINYRRDAGVDTRRSLEARKATGGMSRAID